MSIDYERGHFEMPADPAERRRLFAASVSTVAIELTEHCNRRCSYCPVSIVPRLKNRTLPTPAFERILTDLKSIEFEKSICLNVFNEPTSDRETLLTALEQIREALPKAEIYFSTNGDYLTREYLDALFAAGLSRLTVSIHTPPGDKYNDEDTISRLISFGVRIGANIDIDRFSSNMYVFGRLKVKNYVVNVFTENFEKMGTDRAGTMTNIEVPKERDAPCFRPFETMTVTFDGSMFPCCQFYPDLPEMKKYSIGSVGDYPTIFDAYCSEAMAAWRRTLFTYGPKASPCNTCMETDSPGSPEEIEFRLRKAREFGLIEDVEPEPA